MAAQVPHCPPQFMVKKTRRTVASDFLTTVMSADNTISPGALAKRLRVTRTELAHSLGVSRDAVSRTARAEARRTQGRLRDMIEIIDRVLPWSGSELAAYAWYRSQPLPSFGDRTARDLVVAGHGEAVKTYLSRIADGGHA